MIGKGERACRRASRMGERSAARWFRCLTATSLILVVVLSILEILRIGQVVSAWPAEATAIVMLGWAGLTALASRKAIVELADRSDMLSWALDSAPEAQLIVAADGHTGYANRAFRELFPGPAEAPLDCLKRALCPDPESQAQFRRLRGCSAAGASATASLSLSPTSSADAGRFRVRTDPITGHPGYSYWNVRDVSENHRSQTALRDERNILADLLDNAPIGFYSVDASGRFRFVNRTL